MARYVRFRSLLVPGGSLGPLRGFPHAMGWNIENITGPRAVAAGYRSIYHVTSLSESGAGSLANAPANAYVVFDVKGTIFLTGPMYLNDNQIVAGQTAPGPIHVFPCRDWTANLGSGTFIPRESVTFSPSGATGYFLKHGTGGPTPFYFANASGIPAVGDTVTGVTSGATATLVSNRGGTGGLYLGSNSIGLHLTGAGDGVTDDGLVLGQNSKQNHMFVNCSSYFWDDDNFTVGWMGRENCSVYRCLSSHTLGYSSFYVQRGTVGSAIIQCVMANNRSVRHPYVGLTSEVELGATSKAIIADNLVYNSGAGTLYDGAIVCGSLTESNNCDINDLHGDAVWSGNCYKYGPYTDDYLVLWSFENQYGSPGPRHDVYCGTPSTTDEIGTNIMEPHGDWGNETGIYWETDGGVRGMAQVAAPPFTMPSSFVPINAPSVAALEAYLKPRVGARPSDRDAHDAQIVSDIGDYTGSITMLGYDPWYSYTKQAEGMSVWSEPDDPYDQAPGEATGWTNIEKALWNAHVAVGGS